MSHWIMGTISAVFGLIGLFMAAAARDGGVLGFGLALVFFAVLFCFLMIKLAYDDAESGSPGG